MDDRELYLGTEIDRIAEESERRADRVEVLEVRPIQRDIDVTDVWLVWS